MLIRLRSSKDVARSDSRNPKKLNFTKPIKLINLDKSYICINKNERSKAEANNVISWKAKTDFIGLNSSKRKDSPSFRNHIKPKN